MKNQEMIVEIKNFKEKRDALLDNDDQAFYHDLNVFLSFIEKSPLFYEIINEFPKITPDEFVEWLESQDKYQMIIFPEEKNLETSFRFHYLQYVSEKNDLLNSFSHLFRFNYQEAKNLFKTIVVRPLMLTFGDLAAKKIGMVSEEARDLQAVPLEQIPDKNTTRIFLSHKSIDKPRVRKYYDVLKLLGFEPWLDVEDLSAGDKLDRSLLQGFNESCAAIFFITNNFKDEDFLATEVDYAISQKRKKGKKFSLITLRFDPNANIPELLEIYVWKDVQDDLQALFEILKALPVELGPVRWKKDVLE